MGDDYLSSARRVVARSDTIVVLLAVCGFAVTGAGVALGGASLSLIWAGLAAALGAVALALISVRRRGQGAGDMNPLVDLADAETAPAFISDRNGVCIHCNPSLKEMVPDQETLGLPVSAALGPLVSGSDEMFARVMRDLEGHSSLTERMYDGARACHVTAIKMNDKFIYWRVGLVDQAASSGAEDSTLARISVGRNGALLWMNTAAIALVGRRARRAGEIFEDPSALDGLDPQAGASVAVMTATGRRTCMLGEIGAGAGRRELFLLPTEQLPKIEALSQSQLSGLPVPILKLGLEGKILSANAPALALLGRESLDGETVSTVMEGLGRPIELWLAETAQGTGSNKSEFLRLRRKDREVFVQVMLSAFEQGDTRVIYAVLNDATEFKTLEAQFVQSQKMQAIGQLAGGIAHDFNNLLTAITGHCDLLLLRHDRDDPDYADLVHVSQNANRAAALVSQLLAYSRKQTLRLEVIDLRQALGDLTHLLNRLVGEKVRLTLSHTPGRHYARADKRQFEQVIMNLVVNARDAMNGVGDIQIKSSHVELVEPLSRDRARVPSGRYICITVSDGGVGIDPERLQQIFEPFYTTKKVGEGTGLGLSTAYGIIKQTGGFIFADSISGEGSTFTIYLPEAVQSDIDGIEGVQSGDARTAQAATKGGTILLVEDEPPVRAFVSRALRLSGYTVVEAGSGEEALELVEQAHGPFDMFVSDVIMPGLDGPSWVSEALKRFPETQIIFMSGYAENKFTDFALRGDDIAFLQKPFSLAELTSLVNERLSIDAAE